MIKFLIFIFLHFRVQLDLLTHLAKFQSITNIRSHFILTFLSENLRPPLINLVPRLGCKWEKVTSKTQTYLTGWNYNNNQHRKLHKEQVQSFCCFSRDFQYLLLFLFQPVRYVWVFDVTFSHSEPSLGTRLINGGRKFSEINVKIKWLLMFVMDWNLARWVRRSNCTRKCKKMKIKNLIIGAL